MWLQHLYFLFFGHRQPYPDSSAIQNVSDECICTKVLVTGCVTFLRVSAFEKKNQGHKIMNCISILASGRDQLLILFLPFAVDLLLLHILLGIYPAVQAEISKYALSFRGDFGARRTWMNHFWMPSNHQPCPQRAEFPKPAKLKLFFKKFQSIQEWMLRISFPFRTFSMPIRRYLATEIKVVPKPYVR